jgi:hypothetical protein
VKKLEEKILAIRIIQTKYLSILVQSVLFLHLFFHEIYRKKFYTQCLLMV